MVLVHKVVFVYLPIIYWGICGKWTSLLERFAFQLLGSLCRRFRCALCKWVVRRHLIPNSLSVRKRVRWINITWNAGNLCMWADSQIAAAHISCKLCKWYSCMSWNLIKEKLLNPRGTQKYEFILEVQPIINAQRWTKHYGICQIWNGYNLFI